ncbi:sulfurtransferase [Uliginosibacterium sp. H3]|uniref:Sulfurtransferase n=1 Tax=Uliginosibacterium silvisoli TaxID=3114758 RepID=A0ABU6K593_9RHOO|nr:sulfurtransferase [Uliginosibacterium sp. H3]
MTEPHSFTTLINAATLRAHMEQPDWLILDLRHDLAQPAAGRDAYATGHIPGAIFLQLDEDLSGAKNGRNGRHPLPAREQFAARLAELGLNRHTQVVAYDAQGGMFAARLWWMLRWVGHSAVAVLDGGLPAWQASGGALSQAVPSARPRGDFTAADSLVTQVSATEVLASLGKTQKLIIDARAPDRFRGENETLDPVGGHIPGAANRFFRDNLQADGSFKPAQQLREEFMTAQQAYATGDIIMQCGSGVTACHNLLALEIAGLYGAALYPGSWSEWCSDPARPIARGDEAPTQSG